MSEGSDGYSAFFVLINIFVILFLIVIGYLLIGLLNGFFRKIREQAVPSIIFERTQLHIVYTTVCRSWHFVSLDSIRYSEERLGYFFFWY